MGAHTPEEIVNAYSDGDCWALAQALEERYESMTLVVLGNEDDGDRITKAVEENPRARSRPLD